MQLATQLKQLRERAGLSQDAFAKQIYVSRQTVSNWERGRTYPDVQSLLLISEALDVSIDELIKGDAEEMKYKIEHDSKLLNRSGLGMALSLIAFTFSMAWLYWQDKHGWSLEQMLPTFVLVALSVVALAVLTAIVERIKKDRDLVTYREISDFMDGTLPIEEDGKPKALSREHPRAADLLKFLVSALLGFLVFELVIACMG